MGHTRKGQEPATGSETKSNSHSPKAHMKDLNGAGLPGRNKIGEKTHLKRVVPTKTHNPQGEENQTGLQRQEKTPQPGSYQDNPEPAGIPLKEGWSYKHPNYRCEPHKDRPQGRSRSPSIPRRGRRPRKNTKANSPNIPRPSGELTSNETQDHREDQARPGKKANYIIGGTKKVGTHTQPKMSHKHSQTEGSGTTNPKENRRGTRTHRQE